MKAGTAAQEPSSAAPKAAAGTTTKKPAAAPAAPVDGTKAAEKSVPPAELEAAVQDVQAGAATVGSVCCCVLLALIPASRSPAYN